ncbi:PadR family transcriptional regulator [Thermococcus eurythermalis]|uniref:PadR family transcriptional regulator n=1 Tax=Thermococcus eurythermalis TaxID=1505907 RepID=A0A097QTC6_9EURY|nr:helix-turn-helix transcriptional regulator [Thermococcus eurythermalis]AIU69727.1 PadR family transcriptional regulator [Thermococcus eurythermalis]
MKYRDFLTLHVLHHAREGITGSFMMKELGRHGYKLSPGTIYPLLHELEKKGLLESREEIRNGRRVKVYTITDAGLTALEEGKEKLRELCEELLGE